MKIKRCISVYIDIMICSGIAMLIVLIISGFDLINFFYYFYEYILVAMFLFLIKDIIFKNASIGKKIMNLKILKEDDTLPTIKTVILRNTFMILWPIDAILILANKEKLGDMFFKTKVVRK